MTTIPMHTVSPESMFNMISSGMWALTSVEGTACLVKHAQYTQEYDSKEVALTDDDIMEEIEYVLAEPTVVSRIRKLA